MIRSLQRALAEVEAATGLSSQEPSAKNLKLTIWKATFPLVARDSRGVGTRSQRRWVTGTGMARRIKNPDAFALSLQQIVTILESERLLFRPHEPTDLDSFCAMEMDPEFRLYVGGHARSREDAERKFPRGQLGKVADRLSVWAAVLKANGQYVGRCGLYPHLDADARTVDGEAALSFYFGREHWGLGFASEAGAAFIKFGWEELRLARIVATVQVENGASAHILQKLGFELVATERGSHRSFFKFALASPGSHKRGIIAGSP
jgi:[ribosomal protein S5]-alanine N-acetyltransferase